MIDEVSGVLDVEPILTKMLTMISSAYFCYLQNFIVTNGMSSNKGFI